MAATVYWLLNCHCFKCPKCVILFNPFNSPLGAGSIIISILQIRKLKYKEVNLSIRTLRGRIIILKNC